MTTCRRICVPHQAITRRRRAATSSRTSASGTPRGIQREALPQPGGPAAPSYGQPPAVVYGNRGPEPYPQAYPPAYPPPAYGRGPVGSGQPESYGAAPAIRLRRPPCRSSMALLRLMALRRLMARRPPIRISRDKGRCRSGRGRACGRQAMSPAAIPAGAATAEHGRDASARGTARAGQGRASAAPQAPARARSSRTSRPARS